MEKTYDCASLKVFETREEMGEVAAQEAAAALRKALEKPGEVSCIFAAAPSQTEFLAALCRQPGIDWSRVNACHMDEYVGLPMGDIRSFSGFLKQAVFDRLPFRSVELLNGENNPATECERYARVLARLKPDFVFMGIGENGHIAFNDPPVADFEDPKSVKLVELEHACRAQQVHDGCFAAINLVPTHALTVTIPALLRCSHVFCIVPGAQKAQAVANALKGPVQPACPASILRKKQNACLYVDKAAASLL